MDKNEKNINNSILPEPIAEKYNWGAFLVPFLWGFFNGCIHISILEILIFIFLIIEFSRLLAIKNPSITLLLIITILIIGDILLRIRIGYKANKLSWQNRYWENIETFCEIQSKWKLAGIIIFVAFAWAPIACFILYSLLFINFLFK